MLEKQKETMNNLRFGATNSLRVNLVGQLVSAVLANAAYRGALGFGQNVQAKINGAPVDGNYVIREGETIDIENRAQEKAADARVTLAYGATATLNLTVPGTTRIRDLLTNRNYRAALGFGDGAVAKINGATVRDDIYVTDGLRIDIETRAQEKAAA